MDARAFTNQLNYIYPKGARMPEHFLSFALHQQRRSTSERNVLRVLVSEHKPEVKDVPGLLNSLNSIRGKYIDDSGILHHSQVDPEDWEKLRKLEQLQQAFLHWELLGDIDSLGAVRTEKQKNIRDDESILESFKIKLGELVNSASFLPYVDSDGELLPVTPLGLLRATQEVLLCAIKVIECSDDPVRQQALGDKLKNYKALQEALGQDQSKAALRVAAIMQGIVGLVFLLYPPAGIAQLKLARVSWQKATVMGKIDSISSKVDRLFAKKERPSVGEQEDGPAKERQNKSKKITPG